MALDRDDEYKLREREVRALEKIAEMADIFISDHHQRDERRREEPPESTRLPVDGPQPVTP